MAAWRGPRATVRATPCAWPGSLPTARRSIACCRPSPSCMSTRACSVNWSLPEGARALPIGALKNLVANTPVIASRDMPALARQLTAQGLDQVLPLPAVLQQVTRTDIKPRPLLLVESIELAGARWQAAVDRLRRAVVRLRRPARRHRSGAADQPPHRRRRSKRSCAMRRWKLRPTPRWPRSASAPTRRRGWRRDRCNWRTSTTGCASRANSCRGCASTAG